MKLSPSRSRLRQRQIILARSEGTLAVPRADARGHRFPSLRASVICILCLHSSLNGNNLIPFVLFCSLCYGGVSSLGNTES